MSSKTTSKRHLNNIIPLVKAIFDGWKLEAVSCLVAFISLLATAVTLFPYANNPLPQWPFHVSINTLLSIYTVILKTALISALSTCIAQLQWTWFLEARPLSDLLGYNAASRDAWGSVCWLQNNRLREPLTLLGALLMILSLAIDPFIQQLVVPKDCETPLLGLNATLPRTNWVNRTDAKFFTEWLLGTLTPSPVDSTLVSSSLVCPTGNCTFPIYSTLAYCSSCSDISDDVAVQVTGPSKLHERFTTTLRDSSVINAWLEITSVADFTSDSQDNIKLTSTNMTFLNAITDAYYVPTPSGSYSAISDVDILLVMPMNYFAARGLDPFTSQAMNDCNSNNSLSGWRCRGYGAARCTLYKCARAYQASVRAGRLSESLVAQSNGTHWSSGLLDTACLSPSQRARVELEGYRLSVTNNSTSSSRFISYESGNRPLAIELSIDGCLFTSEALYLKDVIRGLFDQAITADYKPFVNPKYYGASVVSFSGAPQLLSIFNDGNISFAQISDAFAHLSDSLTEYVRTNGKPQYSKPVQGTVWHYATCLEVRWP
ncbi:hypothetical protein F5Y10DRAFT_294266 [Nemania abortiva]|nr:hypothetical protein F5Y10DRAFT_294266 [Nemania abortiva]